MKTNKESLFTFSFKLFRFWPHFVRVRIRRHLGRRGPAALDSESPVQILQGAAVEAFGEYSAGIPIFDFLLREDIKQNLFTTKQRLGESTFRGLTNVSSIVVHSMELNCLLKRSDRTWQAAEAENFRSYISMGIRDDENIPSQSVIETQLPLVVVYALWALLRMRRFEQAEQLALTAATLLASVMLESVGD